MAACTSCSLDVKHFRGNALFSSPLSCRGELQDMSSFVRHNKSICKGKICDRCCLELFYEDKALNFFQSIWNVFSIYNASFWVLTVFFLLDFFY